MSSGWHLSSGCLMCSPYLDYFHNCKALRLVVDHSTAYRKGSITLIEASIIKSAFQTGLCLVCASQSLYCQ